MGIYLAGTGLQIRNNRVTDTDGDGIGSEHNPPRCTDVVIDSNTVRGANGNGIIVLGRRILVEINDVRIGQGRWRRCRWHQVPVRNHHSRKLYPRHP